MLSLSKMYSQVSASSRIASFHWDNQTPDIKCQITSNEERRNVQLDHLSFFDSFRTMNVGHYRGQQPTATEIKRTSPQGPVWIRFQGQFAERRVCRAAYAARQAHCAPALKAIMSTESRVRSRVWERYTRCSRGALV